MKIFRTLSRRGLALFLVLTMCVSLLPATALAAEAAEALHTHNEDGWACVEESQLICGYEQEHTHDETCWAASEASEEPVCGLAESEGHLHGEACYTEETVQVCDLEVSEEHEHGEACFVTETVLTCGQEEAEGHAHGEDCFAAGETVLTCELEEHQHGEACYASVWTCTEPSEDVSRFLRAVKAIPEEITAENVEEAEVKIAEAIEAYQHLGGAEKSNASVVRAYDVILAAEIAVEAAKNEAPEETPETVLPEDAVVIDPAVLVEYTGIEEEEVAVADLFTFVANTYLANEEDPDVVAFPSSLYFVGENVEEQFDIMDILFPAESEDELPEEPETVALTADSIVYQDVPVTAYFLPEETVAQEELLMEMGNDEVELLDNEPIEIEVGQNYILNGSSGANHSWWQSSENDGQVTFDNTNKQTVKITGKSAGTVTITHGYKSQSETYTVFVKETDTPATPSTEPVRVYIYFMLNVENGVDTNGWNPNNQGWYTVGYVDVPAGRLPEPAKDVGPQNPDIVVDYVRENPGALVRYDAHKDLIFDLDSVKWTNDDSSDINGLHVRQNATDYQAEGYTWHMDGVLTLKKDVTYTVTVQYVYDGPEGTGPNLPDTVIKKDLKAGEFYKILTPPLAGYTADKSVVSGTVINDANITVTYTRNQYDVTYQPGDHGAFSAWSAKAYHGEKVPEFNGTKDDAGYPLGQPGWLFDSWEPAPEDGETVTESLTFVARWRAAESRIVFDANGGTNAPAGITGTTGESITNVFPNTEPIREGYTFIGWYTEAGPNSGTKVTAYPATFPAGTTTYYAHWNLRNDLSYTVQYLKAGTTTKIAKDSAPQVEMAYGSTVTYIMVKEAGLQLDIPGYTYASFAPEGGLTISGVSAQNVVTLYYTANGYELTTEADEHSTISAGTEYTYDATGTIEATFSADTGYHIASVTVDGTALSGDALTAAISAGKVTVDMTADHSVAVTSEINGYELTTEADEHSTISAGTEYTYDATGTIEVTFSADTGYHIASVTVDGTALTGDDLTSAISAGKVTVDMTADHSVAVTSEINGYELTTEADEHSTISAGTEYTYDATGTIEVTFSADTGYHIASVTVDGTALSGDALTAAISAGKVTVDMTADHSVAVTSEINGYELTTEADEHSTISAGTEYTYDATGTIEVTFSADTGYHIASVTVDGTALTGDDLTSAISAGKVTVNKTADHSVVVTSAINEYTLTTEADDHSTISKGQKYAYDVTGEIEVIFSASTGYHIASVTVDGTALTGDDLTSAISAGKVTVNKTADHSVVVTSAINEYTLTTEADDHSTISKGQKYAYDVTGEIEVIFSASTGYHIASVTVDGTALSGDALTAAISAGKVTVNKTADHSVVVTSAINEYTLTTEADDHSTISKGQKYAYDVTGEIEVTFSASTGYHIASVTVDGTALTGDDLTSAISAGKVTVNKTADHSVVVTSAINEYTLTTEADDHSTISKGQKYAYDVTGEIEVTFSASTGYHIASVTVDGTALSGDALTAAISAGKVTVNKTADHSVVVTSAINEYTLTTEADDHSTISKGQKYAYDVTGEIEVIFSASTGYHIASVTVDGTALTGDDLTSAISAGKVTVNKTADHSVVVTSAINEYTLTTEADDHSTISKGQKYAYDVTGEIEVIFSASTGYHIASVTVDGTALSGDALTAAISAGKVTVNKTADHSVVVTSAINEYTLTTEADDHSTISKGQKYAYDVTGEIEVTFSASTGYHIASVTVDGTALTGDDLTSAISAGKVTVNKTADHSVVVTSAINEYTLTTEADDHSTISKGQKYAYDVTGEIEVTFSASTGYHIASVTVDGTALSGDALTAAISAGKVTVNKTADHSVVVTSAINEYTLTTEADDHSTISKGQKYAYDVTGEIEVTFSASTGYHIASVTVDGTALSGDALTAAISAGKVTVNKTADHSVVVTSAINEYTLTTEADDHSTISKGQKYAYDVTGEIEVTFSADTGYHIASVTVDGTALSGGALTAAISAGKVTVNKTADHSVVVTSAINEYTLTTEADDHSTISKGQKYAYDVTGEIEVTFSADTGYHIASVTVDGTALSGGALTAAISAGKVTVDMTADHSVAVTSEISSFPYTIEYYFDNELGQTKDGEAEYEMNILKAAGLTDIPGSASEGGKTYALDKVVGADNTITVNADENVVKIYYDLDEKGPKGDKPDGTPDKYQVKVTFVVRNGYWSDLQDDAKFSTPQKFWLTKYKDGEPAVDGTATVTADNAPAVGRLPYDGYSVDSGIWTPGLPMDITEAQTFTYAYLPGSYAYTVNYYYDNVLAPSQTVNGTGTFGAGIPYDASTPKTYAGQNYMLERIDGIGKKITANSAENIVNIYYTLDAIGPDGGPDGIADKYQARVTFVVENGTWTGGTTSQSAVVTLMKDGVPAAAADGGVYQITDGDVPDGTPNAGYLNTGAWRDGRNPANAIINGDTTFTFTYALIPVIPPVTPPGGGGGGGGGTTIPDGPTPLVPDPGTTIADQDVPLAAPGLNNTDHFDYIKGYVIDGQILVRPEANITRAEVATIFFRLMTKEFREANWATENDFTDVKKGDWYNNAISTCTKAGILKGYEDGTFKPNQTISREEFAAIAARFASEEVPAGGMFKDIAGRWSEKDIERAAAMGWIKGSNGLFRPVDKITRAEVIVIVNRMLDRVPDADHMLPDMKTFADNTPDMWWYADVQEATNSHEYDRAEDGVTGIWTSLLPEQDWAALEEEWATAADANVADVAPKLGAEEEAKEPETTGGDDGNGEE